MRVNAHKKITIDSLTLLDAFRQMIILAGSSLFFSLNDNLKLNLSLKKVILTYHDLGLNYVSNYQTFFNYPEMKEITSR